MSLLDSDYYTLLYDMICWCDDVIEGYLENLTVNISGSFDGYFAILGYDSANNVGNLSPNSLNITNLSIQYSRFVTTINKPTFTISPTNLSCTINGITVTNGNTSYSSQIRAYLEENLNKTIPVYITKL